eukprot:comp20971_c0_seq1/m.28067 comp20971_c0_seq1/g.28067  ORF comp20971_c0_seq1/g.28067 comp20971_c0_seq1/m.28067 type:complete len:610 (-) comp20971_c0_seq1:279-2108(-)
MLSRALCRSSIQASQPAVRANARNAAVLARAVHTAGRRGGRWQKYAAVVGAVTVGTAVYLASGRDEENRIRAASAQAEQTEGSLNFRNAEFAFKAKSDLDIMRALFVFKLCAMPWLVSSSESLLKLGEKLHLKVPMYAVIRETFFKQFCAGEDADAVRPVMAKFASNGVGSVLDLSMEVDEGREITPEHCDYVANKIIECIETASAEPGAFTAVKATALAKPEVLLRTSALLSYLKTVYSALDTERTGRVTMAQFNTGLQRMGYRLSEHETQLLFNMMDANRDGCIDPIDFAQAMPVTSPVVTALFQTKNRSRVRVDEDTIWVGHRLQGDDMPSAVSSLPYEPPSWTEEDIKDLQALMHRMERVCAAAQRLGVRIMIDAEQSYFQPVIDLVAVTMMEKFNRDRVQPLVYNTHQMYLKRAVPKLQAEMHRAEREGWAHGSKLVRGAYMVSERRRAHELGIEDPICSSKEETDRSYDQGVALVLGAVAQDKPVAIMVASHNEHSIKQAVQLMRNLAIPRNTQAVYFGQLMGMCDHISLTLGAKSFNIAKYVPYGPIGETIPYLLRRAQENSSILGQTLTERTMLWMELKRRAFNALPALTPSTAKAAIADK